MVLGPIRLNAVARYGLFWHGSSVVICELPWVTFPSSLMHSIYDPFKHKLFAPASARALPPLPEAPEGGAVVKGAAP